MQVGVATIITVGDGRHSNKLTGHWVTALTSGMKRVSLTSPYADFGRLGGMGGRGNEAESFRGPGEGGGRKQGGRQ